MSSDSLTKSVPRGSDPVLKFFADNTHVNTNESIKNKRRLLFFMLSSIMASYKSAFSISKVAHDQVPAIYDQVVGEFYFKR